MWWDFGGCPVWDQELDSMVHVSLSQFKALCDSVIQVLINARRISFFTAQAGACQVLRHSCPVCLYPQMKEIHQQVGPQSQRCWDMNPLSSVIKREQIPVHPFTQDLTSRMLHGVDWANQTLRWNPRGGFAVGGFHRRLQLGERFNKPTKLLTLRNRTHPGETGWNTVALGKELLRDSYCQNFVLFII